MFYGLPVFLFHVLSRLSEGKEMREFQTVFQYLPRTFQRQRTGDIRHRMGPLPAGVPPASLSL